MSAPAYPFLVAAWFILVQWRQAGAPIAGRVSDLVTSLVAALAVAGVGMALEASIGRSRPRSGLIALAVVTWGSLFASFFTTQQFVGLALPAAQAALAWSLCCGLLILLCRHVTVSDRLPRALSIGAVILVLFQVAGTIRDHRALPRTARPVESRSAARPDIYLFVLDKYSASEWLRASYGHDNGAFEDSLRQLGFVLPQKARTNYPHTSLVLASLLDGALPHETIGDSTARWAPVMRRIQEGQMLTYLQDRGYRFAFFPTTFTATVAHERADLTLSEKGAPGREPFSTWRLQAPVEALLGLRCGWRGCAEANAPQLQVFPYPLESAAAIRWKFETVQTLPDSVGPLFALIHVLLPHEPYQFDATCTPQEPWWPVRDAEPGTETDRRIREAYAAQVQCANRLVLQAVRTLIAGSTVPPIILIQGDHGHGRITLDAMSGRTQPLAELSDVQLRERMQVFAAYRLPGHDAVFPEDVTPVSVLPRTLNAMFDAGLDVPADRSWWVEEFRRPLLVTPIDASRLDVNRGAPPSP